MPNNQRVDFRAVREAVTMERVLRHYGLFETFKRTGDNLSGCCPLHQGSNPTQFRVSLGKNLWNCFSECKQGGNALDFIARMEKASPYQAALKAIDWFQLDPDRVFARDGSDTPSKPTSPAPLPKAPTAGPAQSDPQADPSAGNPPLQFRLEKLQRDHPYLAERGLTLETIVDFGIGFCAKGMMTGRIAIPIHNAQGQVVAYVGRHVGDPPEGTPKYKLPPGFRKSLELFNLDRALREPAGTPLWIVEGFFDVLRLHQLGLRKVVGLMGSSLSSQQETLLRQHFPSMDPIVVALDEDDAGRTARDEIATRLARFAFVHIHVFPQEGQQPEHLTADEVAGFLR
jgi:DNA primase